MKKRKGLKITAAVLLILVLAAYSTANLTAADLKVLLIRGDGDGVLNLEKYTRCIANLPEDSFELVITGGNHAQFGSYGPQEGDGEASIPGAQQMEATAREILWLMGQ